MSAEQEQRAARLNALLAAAGQAPLNAATAVLFAEYLALFLRWNEKTNLSAIRDEEGILRRHFVESIACARALPVGVRTLLDFGSGAGLPGIPIAICRPEIAVMLAESQGKKAAFLRETMRVLGLTAKVYAERAERLQQNPSRCIQRDLASVAFSSRKSHPARFQLGHDDSDSALATQFDCVTLRAVDRMEEAVHQAAQLVASGGWLVLMTTASEQERQTAAAGAGFLWTRSVLMPGEERVMLLGQAKAE